MQLAEHAGRCRGFVIFEINHLAVVRVGYRSNACLAADPALASGRNHGVAPEPPYRALLATLTDCGALISRSMDRQLLQALQQSVTSGFVCEERSVKQVDEAARLFAQGELRKFTGDPN